QESPQLAARLIDLAAAARGERPPAMTISKSDGGPSRPETRPAPPAALPSAPTPLLGRAQEVRKFSERLFAHGGRLLTLVGPPGIGKTRLALAVGENVQHFFGDGIYFIPLAAIDDAELVGATLA